MTGIALEILRMAKQIKSSKQKHKTLGKYDAPVVTPTWMLRNYDEFTEMLDRGPVVVEDSTNSKLIALSLKDYVMKVFGIGPSKSALKRMDALIEALNQSEMKSRKKVARK
jgi:hypothetical protein